MIGIYNEKINTIPALIVLDTQYENKPMPVVTYFHGFTSAKEQNLHIAYLLAEKGFRVILPDSDLHGERDSGVSPQKKQMAFWNIVLQNLKELGDLKNYLDQKGLILNDQFGVAGTSMGGITTAATLTVYPWIKTAAVLMGSPKLTEFAKALIGEFNKSHELPISDEQLDQLYEQLMQYDLSLQPEKLNERPILFWHGENDSVVPYDHSYFFYKKAAELYKNDKNIRFVSEPNRDHKVSRYAMLETADWFNMHLTR